MKNAEERRARSAAFLAKANKHLGWMLPFLDEMRGHGKAGDFAQFERVLHATLTLVASTHEALADAAKMSGQRAWYEDLVRLRKSDPLLYYLWKARDAETHDALIKWEEGYEAEVVVVDESKTNPLVATFGDLDPHALTVRLFHHLFCAESPKDFAKKVREGYTPSVERLEAAGVKLEFASNTYIFMDFSTREDGRVKVVSAPRLHNEKPAVPSAFSAIQRARLFYVKKSAELASLA